MLLIGLGLLELFLAFGISKAFDKIWHAVLLQKLYSYGIASLAASGSFYLKKNFLVLIYGWSSTASRLESLRRGRLLFTTKSPEISGTHFIDLGSMKD